jgi:hypothetical protein
MNMKELKGMKEKKEKMRLNISLSLSFRSTALTATPITAELRTGYSSLRRRRRRRRRRRCLARVPKMICTVPPVLVVERQFFCRRDERLPQLIR